MKLPIGTKKEKEKVNEKKIPKYTLLIFFNFLVNANDPVVH